MYIKVRVQAGAKKENIEKKKDNYFMITVKEPAERNMANKRVCNIVASLYKVKENKVRIVSGHQSPSKILSIMME